MKNFTGKLIALALALVLAATAFTPATKAKAASWIKTAKKNYSEYINLGNYAPGDVIIAHVTYDTQYLKIKLPKKGKLQKIKGTNDYKKSGSYYYMAAKGSGSYGVYSNWKNEQQLINPYKRYTITLKNGDEYYIDVTWKSAGGSLDSSHHADILSHDALIQIAREIRYVWPDYNENIESLLCAMQYAYDRIACCKVYGDPATSGYAGYYYTKQLGIYIEDLALYQGVCSNYAGNFDRIMTSLGIKVINVSKNNHEWSRVYFEDYAWDVDLCGIKQRDTSCLQFYPYASIEKYSADLRNAGLAFKWETSEERRAVNNHYKYILFDYDEPLTAEEIAGYGLKQYTNKVKVGLLGCYND